MPSRRRHEQFRRTERDEIAVDDAEGREVQPRALRGDEAVVVTGAVRDLATRQHGVVARRQLVERAVPCRTVDRWLAAGRLVALHRGVYALGHGAISPRGRRIAALLAVGSDGVLSRDVAAATWSVQAETEGPIDVTVAGRTLRPRSQPGLRIHSVAAWQPGDVRIVAGLPVTSPLRTLLDLAAGRPFAVFERALAEAQVLGLLKGPHGLEELRARSRGRPGAAAVAAALDGTGALPTRSRLERMLLRIVAAAGLPRPITNTRVHGFEVDAYWPDERVVVECDGFAPHGHRRAFERDRARDAQLAALGYVVLRFTARQLEREPMLVAARLAAVLVRRAPAHGPGSGPRRARPP